MNCLYRELLDTRGEETLTAFIPLNRSLLSRLREIVANTHATRSCEELILRQPQDRERICSDFFPVTDEADGFRSTRINDLGLQFPAETGPAGGQVPAVLDGRGAPSS